MSRGLKVHREVHLPNGIDASPRTHCGMALSPYDAKGGAVAELITTDAAFICLPREYQCQRCGPPTFIANGHGDVRHRPFDFATPEMVLAIEAFCIALARFAQVCAEQLGWVRDPDTGHWCDGPKEEHRCWFDIDLNRCPCGRFGITAWTVLASATALGFAIESLQQHQIASTPVLRGTAARLRP